MAESRREFFARIGRIGGLKGGKARRRWDRPLRVESSRMAAWCRAQLRTPEQRREQTIKAARTRWDRQEKVDVEQSPQPQPESEVAAESLVEAETWLWPDTIPLVGLLDDDRLPWEKP